MGEEKGGGGTVSKRMGELRTEKGGGLVAAAARVGKV